MKKFITPVIGIIAVVALILAIGAAVGGNTPSSVLGSTRFPNGISTVGTTTTGTLQVGTSGTSITKLLTGTVTCTAVSINTVLPGNNVPFDCAISGVTSGDKVFMTLPSGAPAGLYLANAFASTTLDGYVKMNLGNASSTVTITATGATSSIQYVITR